MRKFGIILCSAAAAVAFTSQAAPLTPEEALSRVAGSGARAAAKMLNTVPVYTQKTADAQPAAYVFASADGNGFRILAGNDVAFPVLGYSDSGVFDPENIPDGLKYWLSEYARQIEWAERQGFPVAKAPVAESDWKVVQPLVVTKWDQGAPYNNQCPLPSGSSRPCYTGCVATSMAQVMNYFKYPEIGHGTITYRAATLNRTLMMAFGREAFDWDNMLDSYTGQYTEAQANAVSYLMKACGYSVQMNYGPDASGASGSSIGASLRQYFDYAETTRSEQRNIYSMTEWTQMIYDNIANIGPVIINGRDFDGSAGHSFICDGYDGNGYFHFNWGWSGMSDGYFSLDALNPDAMGTGGFGGGFNNGQNAILGIQPSVSGEYTPVKNLLQYGNMTATLSGSSLEIGTADYSPLGWGNPFDYTVSGKFALRLARADGSGEPVVFDAAIENRPSITLEGGYYLSYPSSKITATLPAISEDGTYKLTLMFGTGDGDWAPIKTIWGYNNYVYIVKSGAQVSVSVPDMVLLEVEDAEIGSELFYGRNTLFNVTYKNDADIELYQGVVPRLLKNGQIVMQGGGVLVTVPAGETLESSFISKFTPVNGYVFNENDEFDFCLFDPTGNRIYGMFGKVKMQQAPASTSIVQTKFEIEDAETISYTYGQMTREAYLLSESQINNFTVDLDYMVRYGYFDGMLKLSINQADENSSYNFFPIVDEIYSETPFLSGGAQGNVNVPVSFPQAKPGVLYSVKASYSLNSSWKDLASVYFVTGTSGVKDICSDADDVDVRYFNLQGMPVANPEKGMLLIRKKAGKTEKVIY
ncbi:MAG: C10 family peptidase [Muribaculaceae bacterium]|nr:C10 family peptidase [Muribaculaceae bacterium]